MRGKSNDVLVKFSNCTNESQSTQTFTFLCTGLLFVCTKTLRIFLHCHRDAKGNQFDANTANRLAPQLCTSWEHTVGLMKIVTGILFF